MGTPRKNLARDMLLIALFALGTIGAVACFLYLLAQ